MEDWSRCVSNKGNKGFIITNNAVSLHIRLCYMILNKRDEIGISFPTQRRQIKWKTYLKGHLIPSFNEYLKLNIDSMNIEDPYGGLRRLLTNESARDKAAKDVFRPIFEVQEEG